jgi:hypothetical protein
LAAWLSLRTSCGVRLGPGEGGREAGDDLSRITDEAFQDLVATAHALEHSLGAHACCALGGERLVDLKRTALELGEPRLQLALGAPHRGPLGGGGLLRLRECPLNALEPLGEPPRLLFAGAQAPVKALDLGAAVAIHARQPLLRLDPQLLLGILALLDAAQLRLVLEDRSPLGVRPFGVPASLLLNLEQSLLQRRHVNFECPDRRFGSLGTTG